MIGFHCEMKRKRHTCFMSCERSDSDIPPRAELIVSKTAEDWKPGSVTDMVLVVLYIMLGGMLCE